MKRSAEAAFENVEGFVLLAKGLRRMHCGLHPGDLEDARIAEHSLRWASFQYAIAENRNLMRCPSVEFK